MNEYTNQVTLEPINSQNRPPIDEHNSGEARVFMPIIRTENRLKNQKKEQGSKDEMNMNNVFCREYNNCFHLLLPAYIRLTVQDIHEIDLSVAIADISSIVYISVYYGELPVQLVDQLATKLQLEISHRFNVVLRERNFDEDLQTSLKIIRNNETKILTFVLRGMVPFKVSCNIFWAPFERIKLSMIVRLAAETLHFLGKVAHVKFNIMEWSGQKNQPNVQKTPKRGLFRRMIDCILRTTPTTIQNHQKIERMFVMEHTFDFNEYGIVQSSREVYICWNVLKTNSTLRGLYGTIKSMLRKKRADYFNTKAQVETQPLPVNESLQIFRDRTAKQLYDNGIQLNECFFLDSVRDVEVLEIKEWNTIVFQMELMRYPLSSLITILFPTLCLTVINLAIYFQEQSLGYRINNIAILLLSYTTFLPAIRAHIQSAPTITLMEIILYGTMLSSCLCLLRSFISRNEVQQKYDWRTDGLFISSLCILIAVLMVTLIAYFVRVVSFGRRQKRKIFIKGGQKSDLDDRELWRNYDCDKYRREQERMQKCLPFTNDFFQKQAIFYRLWLWRYCQSKLPIGMIGQHHVLIDWSDSRTLTFYQKKALELTEVYYKHFEQFYLLVNRMLYLVELDSRMYVLKKKRESILRQVYQKSRSTLLEDIYHTKPLLQQYLQAKEDLIYGFMQLEELLTENVEIQFVDRVVPTIQIAHGSAMASIMMMQKDTRAEQKQIKSTMLREIIRLSRAGPRNEVHLTEDGILTEDRIL